MDESSVAIELNNGSSGGGVEGGKGVIRHLQEKRNQKIDPATTTDNNENDTATDEQYEGLSTSRKPTTANKKPSNRENPEKTSASVTASTTTTATTTLNDLIGPEEFYEGSITLEYEDDNDTAERVRAQNIDKQIINSGYKSLHNYLNAQKTKGKNPEVVKVYERLNRKPSFTYKGKPPFLFIVLTVIRQFMFI